MVIETGPGEPRPVVGSSQRASSTATPGPRKEVPDAYEDQKNAILDRLCQQVPERAERARALAAMVGGDRSGLSPAAVAAVEEAVGALVELTTTMFGAATPAVDVRAAAAAAGFAPGPDQITVTYGGDWSTEDLDLLRAVAQKTGRVVVLPASGAGEPVGLPEWLEPYRDIVDDMFTRLTPRTAARVRVMLRRGRLDETDQPADADEARYMLAQLVVTASRQAQAIAEGRAMECPRCERVSTHPDDVAQGYCGACHDWTSGSADATGRV